MSEDGPKITVNLEAQTARMPDGTDVPFSELANTLISDYKDTVLTIAEVDANEAGSDDVATVRVNERDQVVFSGAVSALEEAVTAKMRRALPEMSEVDRAARAGGDGGAPYPDNPFEGHMKRSDYMPEKDKGGLN